jgi:uncharacterized coiled-coil DUF342 family protein
LKESDAALWDAANTLAEREGNTQAARRKRITALQFQIAELDVDARQEESIAEQIGRLATAGSVPSITALDAGKLRKEADKYRAEATRLRGEVAELDSLSAATAANLP